MSAATLSHPAGEIEPGNLYTLDELRARLKLGVWAMRTARRNGLPIRRIGTRSFVLGRDVIEYVERSAKIVGATP